MHPDFYNNDAFSLMTLTAVINEMEHIPSRAGDLVFQGIGRGVRTLSVDVEIDAKTQTLIPFATRGGSDAATNGRDKRTLHSVGIPHIPLTEGITADSIQGVRELGSFDELRGARSVIDEQMAKQVRRHDLTLEHLRLGALSGVVQDKNGKVAANLFTLFDVTETEVDFDEVFLTEQAAESTLLNLQGKCFHIINAMKRKLLEGWSPSAKVWAFCGDIFFRKLIASIGAQAVRGATADAKISLGANYSHGLIEFGGIFWENYQGTIDGTATDGGTVGIDPNECRFFITGVPGLYAEWYAPGTFMSAVNTIGLPMYARLAPDPTGLEQGVVLHTQQNPLPVCLKPATLFKGTSTPSTDDINFFV